MPTTRHTETLTVADCPAKRRFRPKQERRQIAEESLQPGVSVAVVARRHGVNANQVFLWRRLLRNGSLEAASAQLLPVRVAESTIEADRFVRSCPGTIHIELGRVRVRLEGSVDPFRKTGDVYRYFEIPNTEFRAFLDAKSHGRFFLAQIRGAYAYERMAKLHAA